MRTASRTPAIMLCLAIGLSSLGSRDAHAEDQDAVSPAKGVQATDGSEYPFLSAWNTPFEIPPYGRIESSLYPAAIESRLLFSTHRAFLASRRLNR